VVANQQDWLLETANVWVSQLALGIEPPLEDGAWNVDRSRDDTVTFSVERRADVNQERAPRHCCMRSSRIETVNPGSSVVQQVRQRLASRVCHRSIIDPDSATNKGQHGLRRSPDASVRTVSR
jgi:hypothetical protein